MKQNIKQEIKEWFEIIAISVVGGLVVLHINGMFSPKTKKDAEPVKTEITKTSIQNDTIAKKALNNVKQLKRQR